MKNLKKVLVLLLVASMCAGTMNLPVFADSTNSEVVDNGNGTQTEITTTVTEETDENGKTTITVIIDKDTKDTDEEDGVKVEGDETITTTTVIDADGTTSEKTVTEGYEKKEWTEEDNGNAPDQPKVTVELVPGETSTGTSEPVVEIIEGNKNTPEGQTTTTVTDRTVKVTTSKIDMDVNEIESGLVGEQETPMKGVAPVYDVINGVKEDKGGMFDYQFNSGLTSKYSDPKKWDMPDGADLRYVGTGEHSKYYVAVAYVEYEKDENGNALVDENGNYIIKELRRYDDKTSPALTINGEETKELITEISLKPVYDNYGGSRPFMFALMDKNGNAYYGYCCDLDTPASDGYYYTIGNLEDSNYYGSKEAEAHIRSIAMNGYWGTTGIPDENGEYAFGSLELLKQKLIAAIDSGEYPNTELTAPVLDRNNKYQPVVDENGEIVYTTKTMKEMIEGLTSGEALLATQAAIWTYANGSYDVLNGKDASIVLDPDGYKWNHDAMGNSKSAGGYKNGEAMDDFASAAVDFLYTWLINLKTDENSTTVINEKRFVEEASLIVGDKVEGHEDNLDNNENNDVYNADLNFKLAFVPGENDDLLVQITYTDLDGNPVEVVKRLAGENGEDQSYETILPEEDGSYILSGLKLSENKDFDFDLRLEGTQYLEKGVYIYKAYGGRENSQNFVGVAEGEKNVDVSASMTISFEVDEDNHIVAEREWYFESDPIVTPPEEPEETEPEETEPEETKPEETKPEETKPEETEPEETEPEETEPAETEPEETEPAETEAPEIEPEDDTILIEDDDIPLTDIPDEPVPQTGDSAMWYLCSVFAAIGLFVLHLSDKKKKFNA